MADLLRDRYEDFSVGVACFAATSAGMNLMANLKLADRAYCAIQRGGLHWQRVPLIRGHRKALDYWRVNGCLRGPKTEAFRRALLGDKDAIVIDRWMLRAMGMGEKVTARGYRDAEERLREVAAVIGEGAACVQARIWTGIRGSSGLPLVTRLFWKL